MLKGKRAVPLEGTRRHVPQCILDHAAKAVPVCEPSSIIDMSWVSVCQNFEYVADFFVVKVKFLCLFVKYDWQFLISLF